ncbi:hypothetical protein BJA5080_02675 [Bradyrhizobium diazoefficiens SEMIA 5080]|uniref:Uncharacterized protein n=1 Tax=Bradyrhizobium diazoefficiens SEMIA 5080 TaxID=754504 RepID=A0A837CAM7_9BRAD|nr:hypothetical protein BJA5080_02675 [Bradyrhizobium diazoefficiens SEMIA 5080]
MARCVATIGLIRTTGYRKHRLWVKAETLFPRRTNFDALNVRVRLNVEERIHLICYLQRPTRPFFEFWHLRYF